MNSILEILKQSLAGEKYSIKKYISQAEADFNVDGKYITGHLLFIPFDENTGQTDISNFSIYIMGKLVAFCIPPKQQKIIKDASEGDSDVSMQLVRAASETLKAIRERKDGKKNSSGEIGELILFVLLEAILEAPSVASKPYLKMNGQDHVKGCDGIHVMYDKEMTIFYGESKLSSDINYCAEQSALSIKDYHANSGKKKDRDLSVIAQNIDLKVSPENKHALEEELLYYLNPIKRRKKERNYKEVNACFLGFDHKIYEKAAQQNKQERNAFLKKELELTFPAILSKIQSKIDGDICDYNFHYFILPFASVEEMQKYCEEYLKPFSFHNKGSA